MSSQNVRADHRVRPEIQALRALAVILVVLYHLWPERLTGGYIGVDVFFVISGFLITLHIAKGLAAERKFSLADFYARRIRRLLPASLLTLLVVGAVTILFVPQTLWGDYGWQIGASALYVENWALSARAVDYLAVGAQPSPVQHFWSLSTEEQFYLVWPLLLILATMLAVRLGRKRTKGQAVAVAVVTLLSLAYSIFSTATDPAAAYFITPTRAWEFGAGGLAALLLPNLRGHDAARAVAAWVGYGGIIAAAVLFDAATPFPGYTALLPVLATVVVIIAGDPRSRLSPAFLTSRRPIQVAGDISYSMYLWHWPLIVLTPILVTGVGTTLSTMQKVLIFAATFAIGWVSKTYVEDPLRGGRQPAVRPRVHLRAFAGMVAGMVLVAGVGAYGALTVSARATAAEHELVQLEQAGVPDCFGAAALEDPGCDADALASMIFPDPVLAGTDVIAQDCQQSASRSEVIRCEFGDDDATTEVALLGDSHANQWLPALLPIAQEHDWHVTTFFMSSCPFSTADFRNDHCDEWNTHLREQLAAEHYDIVITASTPQLNGLDVPAAERLEQATAGIVEAWDTLAVEGTELIAIADTPRPDAAGITDLPSCVIEDRDCDLDTGTALGDDPLVLAGERSDVPVIDMNDLFCDDGTCPAVLGGVLVYRDGNHMTSTFAKSLTPYLEGRIEDAIDLGH